MCKLKDRYEPQTPNNARDQAYPLVGIESEEKKKSSCSILRSTNREI